MNPKDLQQLKDKIYRHIGEMDDEVALQMLEEAAAAYSTSPKKDVLDELTEEQQSRLNESLQQANEGKTTTHEEVKQKAKEWLSR